MSDANQFRLPTGLPTHLCSGKEGFDALCSLLSIVSTKQKQAIANAPAIKRFLKANGHTPPRQSKTAERLRHSLLTFYGDPEARRRLWRLYHQSANDESSQLIPSLEHAAFNEYDESLLTADPDPAELADCSEFHSPASEHDAWQTPALAALPRLRRDFADWHSLGDDRRRVVLTAAFATVTLLDDSRLLSWAVGGGDDIAHEFPSIVGGTRKPDASMEVARSLSECPERDVLGKLRNSASNLEAVAKVLSEQRPTIDLFNSVEQLAELILDLREPALEQAALEDIDPVLDEFGVLLRETAQAPPWLNAEINAVLTTWRTAYMRERACPDQIRADIRRATQDFEVRLAEWAVAQTNADEAKAALDNHESAMEAKGIPSVSDLELQVEQSAKVSSTRQAALVAMHGVLDALTPSPPTANLSGNSANDEAPGALAEETTNLEHEYQPPEPLTQLSPDTQPLRSSRIPPRATPDTRDGSEEEEDARPEQTELGESSLETQPQEPGEETGAADALRPAQAAIWNAVGSRRLGLAYHIALLGQAADGRADQPSPELLAAVALGTSLRGPDDDLAQEFGQRIGDLLARLDFADADQSINDALNLLLFAASLRSALFTSQQAGGIPLLRRVELSGGLTPVYRLAGVVADHAEKLQSVHLDIPTLTAILDEGIWADRIAGHIEEIAKWRTTAASATFLFAPAGSVWKVWLSDSGILSELARLLSTDKPAHAIRIREIADLLADRKSVHDLIENTYRHDLGRRGGSITGRALAQFEGRLAVPLQLAHKWLRIIEAKPGGSGFVEATVEQMRRDFDHHVPAASNAIQRLQQARPALPLASALRCALDSIDSLASIFRREFNVDAEVAIGPVQTLSDDLLFVSSLRFHDDGTIDDSVPPKDAVAFLINTDVHAKTLSEAFGARIEHGDLYGAHAVCNRMAVEADPAEDACRDRLNRAVAENRRILARKLYDLTECLEQAFIIGEVSDNERADLNASIIETTRRLAHRGESLTAAKRVSAIERQIEPRFARGIAKVKTQLDAYLPLDDPREQKLVQDALESGDLTILHEQLDCLQANQPLMSPEAGGRFRLPCFLAVADGILDQLEGESGPSQDVLVRATSGRENIVGLNFASLSPTQAKRSEEFLELWFLMARGRTPNPDLLTRFFAILGFTPALEGVEVQGDTSAVIRTEPLRARDLCPVHAFGSDANGRYEIVLNWNTSARETIIQAINPDPNRCTFVLHFDKLSRADREWLRRWSIRSSVQFVTVDEILVLYLATVPSGTLKALFDCTLPFTCTEPFFTAPGLVPPESFFGRESERRSIMDRYGSCFVYGGRQLGKTALLHAAQAAFHNPESRHLAQCIDLKVHDIGIAYGADHIWQVLWQTFVQVGVVDPDREMPRGRDSLVDALRHFIIHWLTQDEDSRILLLLDEADAFLADDLKSDFRVSTRLKGFMDETQRKFKVVLCGLHNVLRNTERANHPLAHFGEPVCVGPLLGSGDLEQARALIRQPMAAVGYSFETQNLLTQILVWTNYYPSLIQLYGEALVRHLRQAPGREFPHAVTVDDIQAVFARDQFRDYIRDRFSLTLQLDPRYEVIAYAMAFDLLQGGSEGFSRGLSATNILKLAKEAWSDGFDISEKEFGTLLQEMCGLGVLRQRPADSGKSSYVFRNPNVLLLLGDTENILQVLVKERDVPDVFEASAFHAQYRRGSPQSPRRGPLTYEQEALLKRGGRVAVLCGTRAANLAAVGEFLDQRMEAGLLRRLEPCVDDIGLRKQLTALRPRRGTYVYLA